MSKKKCKKHVPIHPNAKGERLMTLAEMIQNAHGAKVYAVIDGQGDTAEIGLYQKTPDDFDEDMFLDWPDDWPERVSVKSIRELGLEVITA